MTLVKATVIIPKQPLFDAAQMQRVIDNTLNEAAKAIKIDFDVTTQTWRTRPKFIIEAKPNERIIATTSDIYRFVSGGTRIRYATMTNPFAPKTTPRIIGSSAGVGGVAFISRKHPRPGIKARKFAEVIATKWERRFPEQTQRAINNELRRG